MKPHTLHKLWKAMVDAAVEAHIKRAALNQRDTDWHYLEGFAEAYQAASDMVATEIERMESQGE